MMSVEHITHRARTLLPAAVMALTVHMAGTGPAQATDTVMARVADGNPWSMQAANGRNSELTLHPDGTGRMRMGIMGMDTSWTAHPGGFCLTAGRMGTRCVTLQAVDAGFVAIEDGAEAFRLTR